VYSVECDKTRSTRHVSRFASRRQILVVPSYNRPRSCGDGSQEGVSVRRTPALRQLPPEAPGHSGPAPRAIPGQAELLLRSRRLQEESDTAVGTLPRPKGVPRRRDYRNQCHAAGADTRSVLGVRLGFWFPARSVPFRGLSCSGCQTWFLVSGSICAMSYWS
jgi:hypothetical protein